GGGPEEEPEDGEADHQQARMGAGRSGKSYVSHSTAQVRDPRSRCKEYSLSGCPSTSPVLDIIRARSRRSPALGPIPRAETSRGEVNKIFGKFRPEPDLSDPGGHGSSADCRLPASLRAECVGRNGARRDLDRTGGAAESSGHE